MKNHAKILIVVVVAVAIGAAAGIVLFPPSATEANSKGSGQTIFSLTPPPFIARVSAAEPLQAGNAFPVDEAGMAAYVNVGETINLTDAVKAFNQIVELSQNHAIGYVYQNNGQVKVYTYVDVNGYIVTYLNRTNPVSMIF